MPRGKMGLQIDPTQQKELKQYLKDKFRNYEHVAQFINTISQGKARSVTGKTIGREYVANFLSKAKTCQKTLSPETAEALYLACDKDSRFEYLREYSKEAGNPNYVIDINPEMHIANVRFHKSMEILPILYRSANEERKQKLAKGLERLIGEIEEE